MNTLRHSFLLFSIITACAIVHAGVANNSLMNLYDVTQYNLNIGFDLSRKAFSGRVRVEATAIQPVDVFVLSAANGTLTIDSVKYHDMVIPFRHENDHLMMKFDDTIQASAKFSCTVFYHGISKFDGQYEGGGAYFTQSDTFGRVATISQPDFARTWWPCKDVPSDKATASIAVTVPRPLTAVSNGILKRVEQGEHTSTFYWETQYPIATYLVSIAAANYKEFSETYTAGNGQQMPITYYVFPKDYEKAKKDFEQTTKFLGFFSTTFCEYPFINEKFGYAEVEGNLTMENQTICSIEENLITGDNKYGLTILHETCHHWWGDLITPTNWKHTWLNEGFATYAEALYLEHKKGPEAYLDYIHKMMSFQNGKFAGSVVGRSDTSFWDSFSGRVYYKGAIVLHMLRTMLGDTTFFRIMRNYLNNPTLRYGNATTDDFIRECDQASGKDLKWFFDQWVYANTDSIDRPEIDYHWKATPEKSGYNVLLELTQTTASKLLYKLPLSITLSGATTTQKLSIIDSIAVQSFTFKSTEQPISLEIENDMFMILHKKD